MRISGVTGMHTQSYLKALIHSSAAKHPAPTCLESLPVSSRLTTSSNPGQRFGYERWTATLTTLVSYTAIARRSRRSNISMLKTVIVQVPVDQQPKVHVSLEHSVRMSLQGQALRESLAETLLNPVMFLVHIYI